jgi:nucleoside-diphosphate-sugar epimerase
MLSNARILLTGASGFIGRHLSRCLLNHGAHVMSLIRENTCHPISATEYYIVDFNQREVLQALITRLQPNYVVHLAAIRSSNIYIADYINSYEANFILTMHLVEACKGLLDLRQFIFLGSCEEYGLQEPPFKENKQEIPVSAYGVSKLAVTQFIKTFSRATGFPGLVLRPSVVYGPEQAMHMFLPAMINALVFGNRFDLTEGDQTRDYIYIDDLVAAILLVLHSQKTFCGDVVNISSANPVKIKDIALLTAKLIGPHSQKLLNFGAKDYRYGESMDYWANHDLAKNTLNWQPKTSLWEGLLRVIHSVQYQQKKVFFDA